MTLVSHAIGCERGKFGENKLTPSSWFEFKPSLRVTSARHVNYSEAAQASGG